MFEHNITQLIDNSKQPLKNGVIILSGPSSCGKGSVGAVLTEALRIDTSLSMGYLLRSTHARANDDLEYAKRLEQDFNISSQTAILESADLDNTLAKKVVRNKSKLQEMLDQKYSSQAKKNWDETSQIDWLEFCITRGFLVPDRWTMAFIESYFEDNIACKDTNLCLLDGYPRTTEAATHLLDTLERLKLPVIKVLHLSISEEEMIRRALLRKRVDDTPEALKERFNFYSHKILPSIDYMEERLGPHKISLINAHQPEYNPNGQLDIKMSVMNVVLDCLAALGFSQELASQLHTPKNLQISK